MKPVADQGYAIVAAVGALAVFASIAYAVLASDRGASEELRGQYAQARLEAAAGAGLAKAVEGLGVADPARRWPIDGRAETLSFEGIKLTIVIEDERGKAPLGDLTSEQLNRLFSGAGARGDQLQALIDAYQDLADGDADPRRHAAQLARYRARGLLPPGGAPATIDAMARLNGMTPAIFARIRPVLTNYFGASGGFTPRTASPLAINVMSADSEAGPDAVEREQELAGDRTAIEIAAEPSMVGHAVTVVVHAQDPEGGQIERRTVVEISGAASPAYYIREAQ